MKNIKQTCKALLVLVLVASLFSGCKEDDESFNLDLEGDVKITKFQVPGALDIKIDELKKTIIITYPGGANVSNVAPAIAISEGAAISPASGASLDLRNPQNFLVTNDNVYSRYTVTANVLSVTAFISHHANVSAIQDDDEKALAEWFFKTYDPQLTAFVTLQDIKDGKADLSKYKTLMWYLDGDANEAFNMPALAKDAGVLKKINDWHKAGGNLYLLGYAGQYLFDLGRISTKYHLAIGNGQGFENGDIWGINVNVGRRKDQSGHSLFTGIPLTTHGDGRKTYPVLGPGWREDHNFVLVRIPEVYGLNNDSDTAYNLFIQENEAKWLATWDGIGDYFMAGILEMLPTTTYKGRSIFQGIGGLEWSQDARGTINPTGANAYQGNLIKMAENAIRYLSAN